MNDMTTATIDLMTPIRGVVGEGPLGSWSDGAMHPGSGDPITLLDPSTGREILTYHDAGPEVVGRIMARAEAAQIEWWALTASERGRVMTRIAALVREKAEALATLDMIVGGKPRAGAFGQVENVAAMFEYYAGWCDKLHGETIPLPTSHLNYTLREPMGVAVQITPWNAPIFTAGWQIAPALAAGNAAVLKPSELTPVSSVALGALCERAGVPAGLVGIIAGLGHTSGVAALEHPAASMAVFVGSAETGQKIAAIAAKQVMPCILELGGKSANIVFDDSDLEAAAQGAKDAIFAASGQSCVAGSRLLVQKGIKDALLKRLGEICEAMKVGAANDDDAAMGPIQNRKQLEKIEQLVSQAQEAGARTITGGRRPETGSDGYYYAPTVLEVNDADAPIAQEEVFGPVLTVLSFDTEDEAVRIANATPYGLAGAVWTQNVARAHRMAAKVRAGTFWINSYKAINVMTPFGGSGLSGHGRSSGREALLSYTRVKSVWVETNG
ncbi:aldehyde dehydrogenase family protein [Fulvimarina sp. MAC3]|uniref:aldehyde dehydrogenase family protein n=1 Tax=Fulvimarina sp. MAC3 TaxID=3148887 RepID=UPI0031FC24E1